MQASEFKDIVASIAAAIERFRQGVETVAALIADLIKSLESPELRSFATLMQQYPDRIREKVALQRALLRRGLVPSDVVMAWVGRLREINPYEVARKYADTFGERGSVSFAQIMMDLANIAALDHHRYTLGAIFPEVERVARNHIYEKGTRFSITSLPGVRIAVSRLLVGGTMTESLDALALDHFVFNLVDAVDFAYVDDSQPDQVELMNRHARVFRNVPNRHHVSHGMDIAYSATHVINALTILYTVMSVAEFMEREDLFVGAQWPDGKRELRRYKAERRKFNSIWLAIAYGRRDERTASATELPVPAEATMEQS